MSSIPSWTVTDVRTKRPAADLTASTTSGTGTQATSTGTRDRYWYRTKRLLFIGYGVPLNLVVLVGWTIWERVLG
jgi:hypothetical protein